jgi:hypothetical protein
MIQESLSFVTALAKVMMLALPISHSSSIIPVNIIVNH